MIASRAMAAGQSVTYTEMDYDAMLKRIERIFSLDADDPEKVYGTLTQVSETGANDIYHILFADGKTRYIPAIPQVVISTDVENKVMTIRPLEGLFEI